ncbi:MAG: ABC transporter ATP-binding protein [Saprospirales bacterium]|nr:MAG: ABC transporter ATP-binding protein [Saprospirales bacterium]
MIDFNNISVVYGERYVLDRITLSLPAGEKVGIIGKNGGGKSTLLKIVAKQLTPDEGQFSLPSETTIGYLHQDIDIDLSPQVIDAVKASLKELKEVEDKLNTLKKKAENQGALSDSEGMWLTELEERFRILGGYTQDAEAERILKGLGFSPEDIEKKVGELSGGWRMRVELGKILLARPELLLLDEPNNHLDMESIIWLESWLKNYEGTALIVSHDAEFIENATSSVLEITGGKAFFFKGSFADYFQNKEIRRENELRTYQNQQKEIADRQRTIDRFRAKATKARMAKSMEKQLQKMDRVEIEEEDSNKIRFRFQPPPRSGDIVLKANELSKSFDGLKVLDGVSFELRRGEKVSLVGKNGEGKTTFIRMVIGELEKSSGEINYGHNVTIGYFAQDQDKLLDGDLTLLQFMEKDCPNELRPRLRGILGSFLFSNDDVEKKIKVLSGGERSRLAMAKLLLKPFNLLILDEPTNHLDIPSKEILKQTINQYEGTVLIVSHDRDFLRNLCVRTCEFSGKKIHNFLGDIDYFLEKKGKSDIRDFEKKEHRGNVQNDQENKESGDKTSLSQEELFALRKQLNRTIKYSERTIEQLEGKISAIEHSMSDPRFFDRTDSLKVAQEHSKLKKDLAAETLKWEKAVEDIDRLN